MRAICPLREWALYEMGPGDRLFMAIAASPSVCNEILTFQRAIRDRVGSGEGIRWVSAHVAHMSLAYLEKSTPGVLVPNLHLLQEQLRSMGTFTITYGGPTLERTEDGAAVWLSLLDGKEEVARLTEMIREGLAHSSIEVVEPSRPHVTVALIDDEAHDEAVQGLLVERADMHTPSMSATTLDLCSSRSNGREVFPIFCKLVIGRDHER